MEIPVDRKHSHLASFPRATTLTAALSCHSGIIREIANPIGATLSRMVTALNRARFAFLAAALISIAAARLPAQQPASSLKADSFFPSDLSPASLPIWWNNNGGWGNHGGRVFLFAKDRTIGYYLGFNERGAWIRHENGQVFILNGANDTVMLGAERIEDVPSTLMGRPAGIPTTFPRREHGVVTHNRDGSYTLTYSLIEKDKPVKQMTFTGLSHTESPVRWVWIGQPGQADPAALAQVKGTPDVATLEQTAPGEPVGSAGFVDVDSNGNVEWRFEVRAVAAAYFAHGEKGKVTRTPDGAFRLSYVHVEPGKPNRPSSFPVTRMRWVTSPQLEHALSSGGVAYLPLPPHFDFENAWITISAAEFVTGAAMFNLATDGTVRWQMIPPQAALPMTSGPTWTDKTPPPPVPAQTSFRGPVLDPNLPRDGAPKGPYYDYSPVTWLYVGSTTVPNVWNELASTPLESPGEEFVYLGFNQQGSWIESPLDGGVYIWNGPAKKFIPTAGGMAGVPQDLSNPSEFLVRYFRRGEAQKTTWDFTTLPRPTGGEPASSTQTGPVPASGGLSTHPDVAPSTFAPLTLTEIHGTGAQIRDGVLTFVDSETRKKIVLKVVRPNYVMQQMQAGANLGITGPWIWVSDDHQQGSTINVTSDGSVTAKVVPGSMALGMISNGSK